MSYRKHLVRNCRRAGRRCRERQRGCRAALLAALVLPHLTCTDVGLYQWKKDPYQANKLTVSGTVCSDDPHQRNFPVKVLFVIDTSYAVNSEKNDPFGQRGKAVEDVIGLWEKSPNYHFGIIAFSAKARNLVDAGFTRDSTVLAAATSVIKGSGGIAAPGGCIAGRCRDLRAAMSLASSVITGDVLGSDPGTVARTTYVIVLFSGGPPLPALGRCQCRDKGTEATDWVGCPWTDCDGCKVTCPPNATCQDQTCYPVCTPSCQFDQYCDSDYICKTGQSPTAKPTVNPLSAQPSSTPDTFTQHIKAPKGGACPSLAAAPCAADPSQYYPDSCEEKTLVSLVRELKDFAKKNGAAQLQLHTTYLPDQEAWQPTDKWYPPCGPDADKTRAIRLLSEMAYAGDGGFQMFGAASAISFSTVDLFQTRDPLVIKELVVTNSNTIADAGGTHVDTDGDGVIDDKERELKTCISDEDTDGDGIGDGVEIKLALDPLKPNDPVECIDLLSTIETGDDPCKPGATKTWKRFADKDGDGLNACEERLLGTSDSLMDSDADGIADKVEFVAGTNFLANDPLQDSDFDGVVNRDEIRGHTDPRSNDAQAQLDLAYRYEEVDEGVKPVLSFTQPPMITGVTLKNVSATCSTGLGYLRFKAGPPPTLEWKDAADVTGGDFGPAVDVTKPNNDGYKLTSCRKGPGGTCTAESSERFITVLVDGPKAYPPNDRVDIIVVSSAERNCLRFRVRNITLMETGMNRALKSVGNNTVMIYFAEAPKNAKDGYGIFRVASIRLNYVKGPPEKRTPKTAELTLTDEDFVLFQ